MRDKSMMSIGRGLTETDIRICDWCGEKATEVNSKYWKIWEQWDFCTGRCRGEFVSKDPEALRKVFPAVYGGGDAI